MIFCLESKTVKSFWCCDQLPRYKPMILSNKATRAPHSLEVLNHPNHKPYIQAD